MASLKVIMAPQRHSHYLHRQRQPACRTCRLWPALCVIMVAGMVRGSVHSVGEVQLIKSMSLPGAAAKMTAAAPRSCRTANR